MSIFKAFKNSQGMLEVLKKETVVMFPMLREFVMTVVRVMHTKKLFKKTPFWDLLNFKVYKIL